MPPDDAGRVFHGRFGADEIDYWFASDTLDLLCTGVIECGVLRQTLAMREVAVSSAG
jgi:hypothetical protein